MRLALLTRDGASPRESHEIARNAGFSVTGCSALPELITAMGSGAWGALESAADPGLLEDLSMIESSCGLEKLLLIADITIGAYIA